MVRGEQITFKGHEVCLFPLDYVYCTQISGPSSYSHCCGHPCDYIGPNNVYPIYAPFSCTKSNFTDTSNGRIFYSDNKVWTPSGLTYATIYIGHDDNPLSTTRFNQGDIIGHTGMYGFVTGDHTHMDQTKQIATSTINSGITCSGGNQCWMLPNSAYPYEVFYMSGAETIVDTYGMNFQTWNGRTGKMPIWMYKRLIDRKRGIA